MGIQSQITSLMLDAVIKDDVERSYHLRRDESRVRANKHEGEEKCLLK